MKLNGGMLQADFEPLRIMKEEGVWLEITKPDCTNLDR